jgi:hypothetical protein
VPTSPQKKIGNVERRNNATEHATEDVRRVGVSRRDGDATTFAADADSAGSAASRWSSYRKELLVGPGRYCLLRQRHAF